MSDTKTSDGIPYQTKLRDLFAAKAMAAYLTRESTGELMVEDASYDLKSVASDAYQMADLMLEARKK